MYSVTDAFNSACAAPGREITSKILFNGTTELAASEVQEISITEQFGSSDGATIGAAFSSQCKVVIYKQTPALPLSGGNFTPYAGIMVDGAAQFVPKGKFYIPSDGVEKTGDLWLTITGYDRMAGLTAEYVPTVPFPATPTQMLVDVCTQAHVTAPSVTMPDIQIAAPYSGSLRQQLGWLAGLIGCNAKFDATGNLVFCWYADNGLTLGWDVQYMDGLELTADGAFTINSLLTGTEENPISVGTGLGITSTNPYMTAEQATVVLAQISGKSLMPCKLKWRGNPAVEAGDSVTVTGRDGKALTVYVMEQRMTIKGGMSADITCYGPEDAEYAVESPTQKKVQQQYDAVREAFKSATEKIIGAKGGYFEINYDEDGYPTGWQLRNTPTVEDDTKMWIMSDGGLGFSSDGGKTISNIAVLATPLALIGLGAGFEGKKALKLLAPTGVATVLKLVVWPALFLPLAVYFGFTGEKLVAILIMLGSPTTVSCYIMAKNMNHEGTLTSSVVVATTFLSSITLTVFLFILRSLQLI